LIDEIHLLNVEERGAILEASVSRIMNMKENRKLRIIALSATIPNINDIGKWLKVDEKNIRIFDK